MAKQLKKVIPRTSPKLNPYLKQLEGYDKELLFETNGVPTNFRRVRTTAEMVAFLEANPKVELDAKILGYEKESDKIRSGHIGKKAFIETFKQNNRLTDRSKKFKEAYRRLKEDAFALGLDVGAGGGYGYSAANTNLVGDDFVPLLGGPFYKQLYYYNDYLLANSNAFYAYHHDPIARAIIDITRNFTVGRGFRVDCSNPIALALWRAFEEVNDLQKRMEFIATELSTYGEVMIWWLPNHEKYFTYRPSPGQKIPTTIIPRIRSLDPTNINEIVTAPEDIENKYFYVWINPTQYQIYTSKEDGGVVPVSKFIYQQIPAADIDHYKVNCVSNEKRGRSDLYPILGYLKRLRDSVNFIVLSLQKNSAWSIDTTVEGDQADIDNYVADQAALGTLPPAGSEFVHTAAIKREYLGNSNAGSSDIPAFDWCLNMIAAGSGIPISYLGTHLSGGSTRASALVATEPVAKKMEMRQLVFERMIRDMANRLFKMFGIDADIEVTFPEIIVQDRSVKLKDLFLAEEARWLSPERCANMAAKEFNITEYDYEKEQEKVQEQKDAVDAITGLGSMGSGGAGVKPLTTPGAVEKAPGGTSSSSAVTSQDKKDIKDNDGY